jgi:hypothetical protein
MTDGVNVKVNGVPELERAIAKVAAAAKDMSAAHELAGNGLAAAIAARTPIRTGLLASSWSVRAAPDRAQIENTVVYAPYVEYGTVRMLGAHMASQTLAEQEQTLAHGYETALADAGRSAGFETRT